STKLGPYKPESASVCVAMLESRPNPLPSIVAPAGIGSVRTAHVVAALALISKVTRYTSPRDQTPGTACDTGLVLRLISYPAITGLTAGTAAIELTVAHARPRPSSSMARTSASSFGHG